MIAARKPAGKGGRPGRGGPRRGGAAAGGRGGAQAPGGARARYAGNVPGSAGAMNPAVQAANQQKQATSEALKIIISNLPLDVEEAAVRVSTPDYPYLKIRHQTDETFTAGTHDHYRRSCQGGRADLRLER